MDNTGTKGLEAFDETKAAVVVAAHADDLETMMGGTVALLADRGVRFYALILTRGDLGTQDGTMDPNVLSATRVAEAKAGGKSLGLADVVTLDYHDGGLEPSLEVRAAVALYYREWQPDTLFTFDPSWAGQIHPDHRAAGRAALDAFMPSKMPLYRPDQLKGRTVANIKKAFLFGTAVPSVTVDVTEVYSRKVAAALEHKSQFPEGDKNVDWMRELDKAAAERANMPGKFVEQFAEMRVW